MYSMCSMYVCEYICIVDHVCMGSMYVYEYICMLVEHVCEYM